MSLLKENDTINSIVNILQDKHAEDILIMDLTADSAIADYFILATGNSDVHMKSLTGHTEDTLDKLGMSYRIEGENSPKWILLDAGSLIVNIFSHEGRGFYRLENIWGNVKTTTVEE